GQEGGSPGACIISWNGGAGVLATATAAGKVASGIWVGGRGCRGALHGRGSDISAGPEPAPWHKCRSGCGRNRVGRCIGKGGRIGGRVSGWGCVGGRVGRRVGESEGIGRSISASVGGYARGEGVCGSVGRSI